MESIDPPSGALGEHADQYRPLVGYGVLVGAFNGLFAAGLVAASRSGRLPERTSVGDMALLGVASFRLARLVSRDRVTSVVRAPLTVFQDDAGHGEVDERAKGTGLTRALGELIVCPECLGQWVTAGFLVGSWFRPRETRAVAALFATKTVADVAQLGYAQAVQKV